MEANSMTRFQAISWSAFTIFIGAIFLGFRNLSQPIGDIHYVYFAYAGFLLALRFKFALDDHFYFGVAALKRWQSILGFVFGAISWAVAVFAGYALPNLAESYLLLLISVGISTLWIVVVALKEGFYKEQIYWLGTNAVYMICAGFLSWESKTETYPDWLFADRIVQFEHTPIVVILIMLLVLAWDFAKSESISHARY